MNFKLVIVSFFLMVLCSTFMFSYFSVSSPQFIEITEEEHRSCSTNTFSVEEYILEEHHLFSFFYTKNINYYNKKSILIMLAKEVIAPPPDHL